MKPTPNTNFYLCFPASKTPQPSSQVREFTTRPQLMHKWHFKSEHCRYCLHISIILFEMAKKSLNPTKKISWYFLIHGLQSLWTHPWQDNEADSLIPLIALNQYQQDEDIPPPPPNNNQLQNSSLYARKMSVITDCCLIGHLLLCKWIRAMHMNENLVLFC